MYISPFNLMSRFIFNYSRYNKFANPKEFFTKISKISDIMLMSADTRQSCPGNDSIRAYVITVHRFNFSGILQGGTRCTANRLCGCPMYPSSRFRLTPFQLHCHTRRSTSRLSNGLFQHHRQVTVHDKVSPFKSR